VRNDVGAVSAHLGATYVLSGAYVADAGKIHGDRRTLRSAQHQVVWTDRLERRNRRFAEAGKRTGGSYRPGSAFVRARTEVEHILTQPLPTLESYSLLLGSIKLMHRSSKEEFLQTRKILDELITGIVGSRPRARGSATGTFCR
jgi:hypothetical protein